MKIAVTRNGRKRSNLKDKLEILQSEVKLATTERIKNLFTGYFC